MKEDIRYIVHREWHTWLDDSPCEVLYERVCPECGSAAIEECEYCEYCGQPFKPGFLEDRVCSACADKLEKERENGSK